MRGPVFLTLCNGCWSNDLCEHAWIWVFLIARSHIFGSQATQSVKHFWDLGKGKTRSVAAGVAYGFPATSPRLTQEKTPVVVKLLIVLIIRLVLLLCSCVWSCVPQCASSFAPRTHVDKRDGNRNRLCGFHQRYARTRIGHGSLLKSSIIKVRTSREAKRWTPLYIYTPYGNAFYGPSPPHPQVVVVVLVVRVRLIVLRRSTSSRLCMGGGHREYHRGSGDQECGHPPLRFCHSVIRWVTDCSTVLGDQKCCQGQETPWNCAWLWNCLAEAQCSSVWQSFGRVK